MAFSDVNSKKLEFLLIQGTHEGELRKFFTESKAQLLMKGARVQNLPHGRDGRVRAICEKLPRKSDDILRGWFQKNVSVADPASLDEVLMYLEAYFDEEEPLPEAEAQVICRSALVYLFDDAQDSGLLRLLRRPLGAPKGQGGVVTPPRIEDPVEQVGDFDTSEDGTPFVDTQTPHNYQIAELIASIIAGDESEMDSALTPFAESTRVLVEALLRLRDGDADAARAQLSLLDRNGPESELVLSALARARHQRPPSIVSAGIRTKIPSPLNGDPDTDSREIVGVYTNESDTGAVFVQPLFLVVEGQLRHLSKDDRNRLFPESGAVMTHKTALRRSLRRRELVHWEVSERDVIEGRTRFHMETELDPLIEVVRIPVPSSDVDEVRDRIKTYAATGRAQPRQEVMFLLSDGVVVVSPKGVDFARDEAFEHPWRAWVALETWLIEGHQYCLDASQGAASRLDISPLDAAFRRLLKSLDAERKLTVSRAQRRELAEHLRSHSGDEVEQRAKRIAASIDQISIDEEELELVLSLLGAHAEVRRRVDELVAKEFEARQIEKAGLQGEISALKKRKSDLEKEGREIERRNHARLGSIETSVREAFGRAIKEGAATLANAEIFRLLADASGDVHQRVPMDVKSGHLNGWIKRGALPVTDVRVRLSELGISRRRAYVLSELSEFAGQIGVALVLKGDVARQCVQILVRQDRDTVAIVDVPMGLTSSDILRKHINNMENVQALAVLNADLSPFEVYGTDLFDLLVDRSISRESNAQPILLSCLDGELSLPLPGILRRVSFMVDLDSDWDEGQQPLDEIDPDAILLLPPLRERMLATISEMDDEIRQHVEGAIVRAACLS